MSTQNHKHTIEELREMVAKADSRHMRLRLNAVYLHRLGLSFAKISEFLCIAKTTAMAYIEEFDNQNKSDNFPRGGKKENLSDDQIKDLINHLETKTYLKCESIIAFVHDTYGVFYTKSGMKKFLHRHSFVYKKPIKVPAKLDRKQQVEFIKKYHSLKTEINQEKEEILFLDGVHPDHQTQAVYGWIRKGNKLAIPTTAKQPRLHYLGAIAVKKDKIDNITKFYEKINGASITNFFQEIELKFSHKERIHIVLDNAGYHKGKEVKSYLENHPKICLHYLPPYSPNLNLIERLWKIMREKTTYNRYYKSFEEFRQSIGDFFNNLDQIQNLLLQRITEKFQVIEPKFVQL